MGGRTLFRVMAYNISGGREADALAQVLRGLRPHVVCVSEAPGRFALARLARRANLRLVVRAGKRRWGSAILVDPDVHVLSHTRHVLSAPDGVPDRVATTAIVTSGGVRIAVLAVQLGLRPEVRRTHAVRLEEILAGVDAPAVLAGDFNENAGGPAAEQLAEVLQDAFAVAGEGPGETYPNPDPSARRDLLFIDRSLAVVRCWVPSAPPVAVASHHRPVMAELAVPEEVGDGAAAVA